MRVIVVGASLSGLYTAYLLAKEGVEVEVYEKKDLLGPPSRTLIVTSELRNVLHFLPEEVILNEVRCLELFSKSHSARLELKIPDLVIERERLVNHLARLAREAGAKIALRHHCEGFALFGHRVSVRLKNLETEGVMETSADILVGADGACSQFPLAASRPGHLLAALNQAKVRLPEEAKPDTVRVWFDSDRTKYFYWLIPESDRTAAVGLIADEARQAEACLNEFLKNRGWEPVEFQSALVPRHRFLEGVDVLSDHRNVFAVGDAAAQVKVTTFGGVVPGLLGAKALADAVLNGRNYSRALRDLKIELNLHLLIREILNRFSGEDYDQLIGMIHGGLKETLEEWNRDALKQSFLRLIWNEPRLVMLGTKVLLRSLI